MSTPKKETTGKTLLVAFVLCIVCSVIVAGAAVSLKPIQSSNKALDRKTNILAAAGMLPGGEHSRAEVEELFGHFEVRLVDLDTGTYATEQDLARPELDPARYDQVKAAKDAKLSAALDDVEDVASIGRRERFAQVYLIEDQGRMEKIVLPIRGYGLWSTLYGFLVLEGDRARWSACPITTRRKPPGLAAKWTIPSGRRCGRASRSTTRTARYRSISSRVEWIRRARWRDTRSMRCPARH